AEFSIPCTSIYLYIICNQSHLRHLEFLCQVFIFEVCDCDLHKRLRTGPNVADGPQGLGSGGVRPCCLRRATIARRRLIPPLLNGRTFANNPPFRRAKPGVDLLASPLPCEISRIFPRLLFALRLEALLWGHAFKRVHAPPPDHDDVCRLSANIGSDSCRSHCITADILGYLEYRPRISDVYFAFGAPVPSRARSFDAVAAGRAAAHRGIHPIPLLPRQERKMKRLPGILSETQSALSRPPVRRPPGPRPARPIFR